MKIGLSYDPFDTGQAAFYSGEKIGEGVRALGDKIRMFHIHDT